MDISGKSLVFLFWLIPLTLASGVCDFDIVGDSGFLTCRNFDQSDDYLYQIYKFRPELNNVSLSYVYIFISNSNLQDIDQWFVEPLLDISIKISMLSLYNCSVKSITPSAFHELSELTYLDLSKNSIKSYEFLSSIIRLRNLNLAENGLGDDDIFNVFNNISSSGFFSIDLSVNKIKNINFSLAKFKNFELNLMENSIETFDYSKVGISNAILSSNPITEIILPTTSASDISLELAKTKVKSIRKSDDTYNDKISVMSLDVSSLDTALDLSILSNVTVYQYLNLKDNKISNLDNKILIQSITKDSTLDLSNTGLTSFSNGFFNKTQLSVLNLTSNPIKQIPPNLFNQTQIGILDLSSSQISKIDPTAFSNLEISIALNISGNNLASLDNIFEKTTLKGALDLSSNPITKITVNTFQGANGLSELNLINTSIASIEEKSFQNLLALKTLYITIQGTFNSKGIEHHFLKTLGIMYSTITKLENENFKGMYTLQTLYFNNSVIKEVSNSCLDGLFALTYLDAKTLLKYVKAIPSGIFKDLKSLVSLDLSNMNWTSISYEAMTGMKGLNILNLTGNNFSEVPEDTFQDLISLSELYLSRNQLRNISSQTFQKLWSLKKLYIDDNALTVLPVDLFQNTSLTYLNLSTNLLMSLEPGLFSNLNKLQHLDLSKNRFVTIQSEVFKPLVALNTLNLENNLLHSLSHFENVFNYTSLLDTISPTKMQLNGNPWECKSLGVMLNYLDRKAVQFSYPDDGLYSSDNIVGITCSPEEDMDALTEVLQLTLL